MSSDIFGLRQRQFEQNDNRFWQQMTPTLRQHLNQSPNERALDAIKRDLAPRNERSFLAACRALESADTPREASAAHAAFAQRVARDLRDVERRHGKKTVGGGTVAPLPQLRAACASVGFRTGGK